MSYLIWPEHRKLAGSELGELPYCARALKSVVHFRDNMSAKNDGFWLRVSTQVAFVALSCVSLIEIVARAVFAIIGSIIPSKAHWTKAYAFACITILYALTATLTNLFAKKVSTPILQTDVFLRRYEHTYMLFDACKYGHLELAKMLKDKQVDAHEKIFSKSPRSFQATPALMAHLHGHKQIQKLFPLDLFEQSYQELKHLSHWLNLSGEVTLDNQPVKLEGTSSKWMFKALLQAFKHFRTQPESKNMRLSGASSDLIEESLSKAFYTHDSKVICRDINSKGLTFLDTGWENHGICLVFFGNYLAICNRGEGSDDKSTIEVFKIDPSLATEALVDEILMHHFLKMSDGKNYLYNVLPAKLSASGKLEQDKLCEDFRIIAPSQAKSGNCALTSKKSALRFAWAMLLQKNPDPESLERAKKETKIFTDYAAVSYYETVKNEPKFQNLNLAGNILRAAQQRSLKKRERYVLNTGFLNSAKSA